MRLLGFLLTVSFCRTGADCQQRYGCEPTVQRPESVQFQDSLVMCLNGLAPSKEHAAVVAEVKRLQFIYRTLGRQSAADYGKSRRLLLEVEEKTLIWRCDILQRGWISTDGARC